MKVGDLIRLRLPHMDSHEIAVVVENTGDSSMTTPTGGRHDPTDVWWKVLLNGQLTEIHQDYVREVINEGR